MKKVFALASVVSCLSLQAWCEEVEPNAIDSTYESSFVTYNNDEAVVNTVDAENDSPKIGRKITDYVSIPKFGGYFIGSYKYNDKDGGIKDGNGFDCRLVRLYVDGTILNDFKYRLQIEVNGTPHVKDFFFDWVHWKEFGVKVGQFKRCFTFENPYNPWDVGTGEYSQAAKKLSGLGDYNGEASMGGRDQGIELHGDFLPVGKDKHSLIHYQLSMYNGQGINTKDKNGRKDFIGTIQFQPVKDLYIGLFGWTGDFVKENAEKQLVTVGRNRWGAGVKYEHNAWTVRSEYFHNTGHKISDYNSQTKTFANSGRSDAWYATVGVPVNNWLKVYAKYDAYRDQAKWNSLHTIYSITPNFQLHKNLQFQIQYNYHNDKTSRDRHYNELWAQAYVRF